MDKRTVILVSNLALLLLAVASIVESVIILNMGTTVITGTATSAATGNLASTYPLNIVAGLSDTKTINGGSFTLNRNANVTVSISTINCTSTHFNYLNMTVAIQQGSAVPSSVLFDLLATPTPSQTFLNLAQGTWTVTYTINYGSKGVESFTFSITVNWAVTE